jgi:hypothetical protein
MSQTRDPNCNGRRRALLVALSAALALAACGKARRPERGQLASTDLAALKRLIKLPAEVTRAEWQTGAQAEHGGDWWVAAVLDVPADAMPRALAGPGTLGTLDTPPGMQATAAFAQLKALPGAAPVGDDRWRLAGELHGVEPYASSPLLHGNAMRLSATQVFVLLWTN